MIRSINWALGEGIERIDRRQHNKKARVEEIAVGSAYFFTLELIRDKATAVFAALNKSRSIHARRVRITWDGGT